MVYLLQQLANSLPLAALYAALAFGYALIFGMTRRADITYGALFAFSGQIYVLFAEFAWNDLYLVLPAALALGAVAAELYALAAGALIGRHVMRPLYRHSPNIVVVASLAVLIILSESARLAADSRVLWLPPFLNAPVVLLEDGGFRVTLTVIQLVNTALMAAIVIIGHGILRHGRIGRLWRAVCDDARAAEICGVDSGFAFVAAYLTAAMIAAVCGILSTSYYGTMDFSAGLVFGLKVVLIAAAGGTSSPTRSALGAAVVGLAETLWSGFGPTMLRDLVIVSGLVAVLVLSRRERVIP
ncbi:branched-chain amino acid ABC transporter permease [Rhizobium sp. CG5]|uniref:branched-chain amino acid ABC transporter permease n=1 Tax=Rhizobium sp. CG5 TaxID=2726076 RepID=UPI0020332820|nr:branched-chain amino acid ABC transporter permease [Rhizobium sp. CG5]MCM2473953.1 branched-chain amino acid ABC transporter permease [Rhizobium sp. CG5]